MLKILILFAVLISFSTGSDLITDLPGAPGTVSFNQYSGYLDASDTKKFHYWFAESQNNPSSDPLVLWLNGGPGCSSLDGFLSENGPLLVNNDGETLRANPYSWNKMANVIYLESPAGVGYSYDSTGMVITDDDEVAQNNYNSLLSFIKKYPQFAKNDFYISGESYAGIYLPTLALKILNDGAFNFKGMAVGNGLSSDTLNTNSLVFFAYYHGLYGIEVWNPLSEFCCNNNVSADTCDFSNSPNGNCQDAVEEVMEYVYHSGLNSYALYMDCYGNQNAEGSTKRYMFDFNLLQKNKSKKPKQKIVQKTKNTNIVGLTPPCINSTAATNYLNKQDVRDALHIPNNLPSWSVCSDQVNSKYKRIYSDMFKQYSEILSHDKLKILLYNGDTDMACNFMGTEWFVDRLQLQETSARQPWLADGQVAGFEKSYKDPKFSSTLKYTTIRGAGHMVPQWAPKQAFQMFSDFIASN